MSCRDVNQLDGQGNDNLTVGRADQFLFSESLQNSGIYTITDFKAGEDTIGLSKSIFSALGDISASDIGSGAYDGLGDVQFAVVLGRDFATLEVSDFYLM